MLIVESRFSDAWSVAICFLAFLASAQGADITDDFSNGVGSWLSSPGWVLVEQASGSFVYRGDAPADTFSQNGALALGDSWRLEVDVHFRRYRADGNVRGLTGFALFPSFGSGVQLQANLGHRTNDAVEAYIQWFNPPDGTWHNVFQKDWTPNRDSSYRMHLYRAAGSDRLVFKVVSANGSKFWAESSPIPLEVLNRMKIFGLRVNSSQVEFSNLREISPYVPPPPPQITVQPESRTVTLNAAVTFRVGVSGPGPFTYQWMRGAARINAATNATYTIPKVTLAHAGSYTVIVGDWETKSTSSAAVLRVIDAYIRPSASITTNRVATDGFAMELGAPAGVNFVLQQTTDFLSWTDVVSTVGIGSPVDFKDLGATNQPIGFYRLLLP